jgi:hypothetical protein
MLRTEEEVPLDGRFDAFAETTGPRDRFKT